MNRTSPTFLSGQPFFLKKIFISSDDCNAMLDPIFNHHPSLFGCINKPSLNKIQTHLFVEH